MANNTVKSRFTVCSKTTSEWESNTTVVLKGEFAVELTGSTPKVKIGNGVDVFKDLPYLTLTSEEINALVDVAKAYTDQEIAALIDSAPETLNTLRELAEAIATHQDVTDALNDAIVNKVDKEDGKGLSTNDYTTEEKNKLDTISSGAEVNQNAFSNIKVGDQTISATLKTDTIEYVAGDNITITPDATNKKVTISVTGISNAAGSELGLVKSGGDVSIENGVITVNQAGKLKTARNFSISGAVTAEAKTFDGTGDIVLQATSVNAINLYVNSGDTLVIDGNF